MSVLLVLLLLLVLLVVVMLLLSLVSRKRMMSKSSSPLPKFSSASITTVGMVETAMSIVDVAADAITDRAPSTILENVTLLSRAPFLSIDIPSPLAGFPFIADD
jgi:hypothetical protein